MAYSSSVKRAQAIKFCELCNEENIKWRCVDCELCLCEKCKTSHLKIPVTAKHQIVTIATPIQAVQRRIVTDNIPCKYHGTKMNCLYCKTCESLVCPECVSIDHTKHLFIPIENALDGKMNQLKGTQAKVIESLNTCDSKSKELQHLIPKYNSFFDESLTKIKQKEQELKEAISKHSRVLQDKVELERLKVKTAVTEAEQQIDRTRKKLKNLQQEIETAFTSNRGKVIFDTTPTAPTLEVDRLPHTVGNFIPEMESTRQIQKIFGSFQEVTIPKLKLELGFEVLRTFTTDLPVIHAVIPLGGTSAWIICNKSDEEVMRKVTAEENNIVTTDEMNLEINDMALFLENGILLTTFNTSDVMLMSNAGEIRPFLTVAPLCPYGIHVTSDKKVIIGVKELGNVYTPTEESQRAILVFDMDGKQEHRYQYDSNRQRLFTVPDKITTTKNMDIVVIDQTSSKTGRVVTLDKMGCLRWIYIGHDKINSTKQFRPVAITTTADGYTIVTDYSSNTAHLLSETGAILSCKVMDDIGIKYTWGLSVDNGGKLWVSCGTGGKDSGAKLHIVKLLIK